MKRNILWILVLIFCLTGCAGAAKSAQADTQPLILPAADANTEDPGAFLLGKWVNLDGGIMTGIEFLGNNTANLTRDGESKSVAYRYAGGMVTIEDELKLILRVTEEREITHLRRDAVSVNLVREADAPLFAPRKIEITMDNWQDYFEVRFITHVNEEVNNGIQFRSYGAGFLLKQEYLELLSTDRGSVDVAVTIEYDSYCHTVFNPFSEDVIITDDIYEWSAPRINERDIASVVDRRDPSCGVSPLSDLYGQVAAMLGTDGGYEEFPATFYYQIMERMDVVAVEGTIVLIPEY